MISYINIANQEFPTQIFDAPNLRRCYVESCQLTGTLPSGLLSTTTLKLEELILSHNNLSGTLPPGLFKAKKLLLSNNNFHGSIPNGVTVPNQLDLSWNQLSGNWKGTLPPICGADGDAQAGPEISASNNHFDGELPAWISQCCFSVLNLASNQFTGSIPSFSDCPVASLTQATFNFSGNFLTRFPDSLSFRAHVIIDVSDNLIDHVLDSSISTPGLLQFSAAYNQIPGDLSQFYSPISAEINLNFNQLEFDIKLFAGRAANSIKLQGNHLYGSLDVLSLATSLSVDLSYNNLNESFNVRSLGFAFKTLQLLNIEGNPNLPQINSIEGLTKSQRASSNIPDTFAECFELSPSSDRLTKFAFDTGLFSYLQCQCMTNYYGKAPNSCFPCPTSASCNGTFLQIPGNYYVYKADNPNYLSEFGPLAIEECSSIMQGSVSSCTGSILHVDQKTDLSNIPLDNISQCKPGSTGRLCSKCICDSPSSCYFGRLLCAKCRVSALKPSFVAGMTSLAVILVVIVLSIIMFLTIRSSRRIDPRIQQSLPKRIFYRLLHASRMGYLPILITFLQFSATLLKWQEMTVAMGLQIINGDLSGIGLSCLLPFLHDPLTEHVISLTLPLGICIILFVSVLLGELLWRLESLSRSASSTFLSLASDPLLGNDSQELEEIELYYPWTALASSSVISVVQFFYFGISLNAVEYFVSDGSRRGISADRFVRSTPWMLYSEANTMRLVSIPFLVLIVAGLPLTLLAVLLKESLSSSPSSIMIYLGSFTKRYQSGHEWWEVMRLIQRLMISLSLTIIDSSSAFRPSVTVTLLCASLCTQFMIKPWKRPLENLLEPIGFAVLILTTVSVQLGPSLALDRKSVNIASSVACLIYPVILVSAFLHAAVTEPVPLKGRLDISTNSSLLEFDFADLNKHNDSFSADAVD
jgi:hypothetical protein